MMIGQGGPVKVYVATRPVDFRKGIDGLALAGLKPPTKKNTKLT